MHAERCATLRNAARRHDVRRQSPPHPTQLVPLGTHRRKASAAITRTTSDDARLLPRHREPSPILDRRRLEREQATALLDVLATNTGDKLPLRHELTKPGDTAQLRGIPVLGAGAGAIRDTLPHIEAARRIDAAIKLRDKTRAA